MASRDDGKVLRLIGVYNADGSLFGELRYVVGSALGRAHCELCDITHSRVRKKRAFVALQQSFPISLELLHRDEQPDDLAACTAGQTPCVVAETSSGYRVVMTAEQLARCGGDVRAFEDTLRKAVQVDGGAPEVEQQ